MPLSTDYQEDAAGTILDTTTGDRVPTKRSTPAAVVASTVDSSIITAVASKRLRVIWAVVIVSGAMNVTFNTKGAGAGTALTPAWPFGANGGFVLPYNVHGWFTTSSGEALTVTTGPGGTAMIFVGYVEVT